MQHYTVQENTIIRQIEMTNEICMNEDKHQHQEEALVARTIVTFRGLVLSYRPPVGLAAAKIEVRAFSVACIPALVMLIVCCSIAS